MKKTTGIYLALFAVFACAAWLLERLRIPLLLASVCMAVCALMAALRKEPPC